MENKVVNIYMERFNKIIDKNELEDYRDIKKEMLAKCKSDKNYMSIDYLMLELERINLKLEQEKSQYISIIYAIMIFIIPTFITVVLKLIGIDIEKLNIVDAKMSLLYLFIPLMIVIIVFMNKMRTYKCYYIYKAVIEEIILDIRKVGKKTEVAVTENSEVENSIN